MKLSIGIPTYDAADTLGEAIEGALSQRFSDFELLVSDNASTDGTRELIDRYRDPRIRYHRHAVNVGYPRNCRTLIERARGELLAILCADDYWPAEFLTPLVEAADRSPRVTLAYSGYRVLTQDGSGKRASWVPRVLGRPALCDGVRYVRDEFLFPHTILSACLFRRRVALEQGSFTQEGLRFLPDLVHRLRVGMQGDVAYVAEPLAVYREHAGSITARHRAEEWVEEEARVRVALVADEALRAAGLASLHEESLRRLCETFIDKLIPLRAAGARARDVAGLADRLRRLSPAAFRGLKPVLKALASVLLPGPFCRWYRSARTGLGNRAAERVLLRS